MTAHRHVWMEREDGDAFACLACGAQAFALHPRHRPPAVWSEDLYAAPFGEPLVIDYDRRAISQPRLYLACRSHDGPIRVWWEEWPPGSGHKLLPPTRWKRVLP